MTAEPAEADVRKSTPERMAIAVASVLAAMTLVVLDAAMTNVALPAIGQSLGVTPAEAVRVVNGYQLGLLVALLPSAALGGSVGFRRVFVAGTVLFITASLLCALAPTLTWLVLARVVQGMGGAAIMALGIATLRTVVPRHRLGAAIGWNALVVALASAAGPAVGALILSTTTWPWLFAINLPVGAVVLVCARALPASVGTGSPVDRRGFALNAGAFALLVLAAESGTENPLLGIALGLMATALAVLLIHRDLRRESPLVPMDLLRAPSMRVSVIASVLCFAGQSAGLVALPFLLLHAFHWAPLAAGLCLSIWPLTVALAGPLAGKLADRVSTAGLCAVGGMLLAAGLGAAATLDSSAGLVTVAACLGACGVGFGMFNVPNNRNMFLSVPPQRSGAAGGLQSLARLSGQTFGALLMSALFKLADLDDAASMGLALGAVFALAAGATSLLRRQFIPAAPSAQETRSRPPGSDGSSG